MQPLWQGRLADGLLCCAGWYCVGCEAYKDDSEMEGDRMCPTHKKRCVERQEENYFFALSKYQSQIQVWAVLLGRIVMCQPPQLHPRIM